MRASRSILSKCVTPAFLASLKENDGSTEQRNFLFANRYILMACVEETLAVLKEPSERDALAMRLLVNMVHNPALDIRAFGFKGLPEQAIGLADELIDRLHPMMVVDLEDGDPE